MSSASDQLLVQDIRAGAAKAAETTAAPADADRAKIKNMERAIRRVRSESVEGQQATGHKSQDLSEVLHVEISSVVVTQKIGRVENQVVNCLWV